MSDAALAALAEASSDAIVGQTLAGVITSWNPAAERVYGFSAEEALGQPIELIVPESERSQLAWIRSCVSRGVRVDEVESRRRRKDGASIDVRLSIVPLRDASGAITGTLALSRDVGSERRAALAAEDEFFRSAFDDAPVPMLLVSQQLLVLRVNRLTAELLGYTTDELEGVSVHAITHADDQGNVLEHVRSAAAGRNEVFVHEKRYLHRDGTSVWAKLHSAPVFDRTGALAHFVTYIQDVSEQRRAEQALGERERELAAIFESTLDAILITDDERCYIDANPAAVRLLGLPRDEIIGRRVDEFVGVTDPAAADQGWASFIADGSLEGTFVLHVADGSTRVVDHTSVANVLPGQHLSILRDVTESNRIEDQLRQAQKMEAVGQLAGGVAHDFNNLLMVINGNAELAAAGAGDDAKLQRRLGEILSAGSRGRELTQQLLAFGRRQIVKPCVLDLNTVAGDAEQLLRRLIGEHVEIVSSLAPDLHRMVGDAGQIGQVLMNLAVNARDAMPGGGTLTIETANVELDERAARALLDATPGTYVVLTVTDTGEGMDTETRSHLFEPFFTTKPVGHGTGLGLATVYGIVKQSDGFISVASEPGHGSVFTLFFPRTDADLEQESRPRSALPTGVEHILLVEDEDTVRKLVTRMLEHQGYRVTSADGPAAALALADTGCDLLLTDVVMPQMNGRDLADRLRADRPGLRVVYMSGYTTTGIVEGGVLDSDLTFLHKPFTLAEVATTIRDVLDAEPTRPL